MGPQPLQLSLNVEEEAEGRTRAAGRWTQPKIISFDDGEGATRHRMQASSRKPERARKQILPRAFGRKAALPARRF